MLILSNETRLTDYRPEQTDAPKRQRKPAQKKKPRKSLSAHMAERSEKSTEPSTQDDFAVHSTTEDGMATEMRNIIEKMQQWKSKDPDLFAKLWGDLKRV